ncbi:hypothetical protein, conserved [Plasmodium gonderi]|uniref:Tetratricopeptide repeat protein n=1 Tax=Plasmodium gonderi TaxID=77519 RepID=A0A1Y1JM66_PLAGO|nr:hypothetical protein, conserved [Plasmodium gonderi]GAW81922.1 hypothetical protein, conserved [Plasmodium gonderi]
MNTKADSKYEKNKNITRSFHKKNVNEDSEYNSDSFIEHLFNVNKINNIQETNHSYDHPQFKNDKWYNNRYNVDARNDTENNSNPFFEVGVQELHGLNCNGNFQNGDRYSHGESGGRSCFYEKKGARKERAIAGLVHREEVEEREEDDEVEENEDEEDKDEEDEDEEDEDEEVEDEEVEENEEDVMKYYSVVKSNKMNDENLEKKIDKLLNFNKKIETYEEKKKKLILGSMNDDEIDHCLYDQHEEGNFFMEFLEDLSHVKNNSITESADYVCPNYDKNKRNEYNEEKSKMCNSIEMCQNKIVLSVKNRHVIFNEKRLLDIKNINLKNIMYFYFCSNEEYVFSCIQDGAKHLYTYDSYIFENYDDMSNVTSNSLSDGNSKSDSITDEELLLLTYNNTDEEIYNYDDPGYYYNDEYGEEFGRKDEFGSRDKFCDIEDSNFSYMRTRKNRRKNKKVWRKKKFRKGKNQNEKSITSTCVEPTKMNREVEQLMNKANSYYINKNFEECILILEKVIKLSPNLQDPFHLLGLIYEREYKNMKKAINYYLIAAHLSHNDYLAWYTIIDLCKIEKQYNIILYCLYKVLKIYKKKRANQKKKNMKKNLHVDNDIDYIEKKHYSSVIMREHDDAIHFDNNIREEEKEHVKNENKMEEMDDFMKHLYFNLAFTYILLGDYKNGLKFLLQLRDNCEGSLDIIIDLYICICLVLVRSPEECYNFLKNMYLRVMKKKQKLRKIIADSTNANSIETQTTSANWSYVDKSIICFFMQSQILNNKYDECIFLYITLAKMCNEKIHIDIFMQFIKSLVMIGNVDYRYLNKCYFLNAIRDNHTFYEDLIFHLAEAYYIRSMYKNAIYFYNLLYIQRKGVFLQESKPIKDEEDQLVFHDSVNGMSAQGGHFIWAAPAVEEVEQMEKVEKVGTKKPKQTQEGRREEMVPTNNARESREIEAKNLVKYDNKVPFLSMMYKLVKCYYYVDNFTKAEKMIVNILRDKNIEKNHIEIDIKTLYVDILYKLKKYNRSINILLSIKEKKLRFMCSIPNPLSNKEREILLLKILNKKNKLLLYISHNKYILHMFYIYQKKNKVFYKYDNYISNRNINDIIQVKVNICFCYFCVKYNFSILNYLYLYNVLNYLNRKNPNGRMGSGGRVDRGSSSGRGDRRRNRQRILNLYAYREYLLFLASSFQVFKKRKKLEDFDIHYKNMKLIGTRLFYKDVFIFDVNSLADYGENGFGKKEPNGFDKEEPNGFDKEEPNRFDKEEPNRFDKEEPNRFDIEKPNEPAREEPNEPDREEPNEPDREEPNEHSKWISSLERARVREKFHKQVHKYTEGVESEIFKSKIMIKFYKFSYNFFYFLYEIEHDFRRIRAVMEKDILNFKKKKKNGKADEEKEVERESLFINSRINNHVLENNEMVSCTPKENSHSVKLVAGYSGTKGSNEGNGIMTSDIRHVKKDDYDDELDFFKVEEEEEDVHHRIRKGKFPNRSKRFSFLVTKKKMNFFTFENYLGLYFSLLFIEECFFIVSIMNMYEDAIHILNIYIRNRKSSKMKFLTYIKAVKNEFKRNRNDKNLINLNYYFFDNVYTKSIKNEMKNEYYNFLKMNKYIDCKYFLFRINLLLNKLYISSGDYEKQVKCLNDAYIFNKKEKDEYRILKYYSDIVLTGTFCQNFLTSISKSKNKNILIIFRLFLVKSIHYKNTNPFLIYLIGNVCNLSCMIINAVHEYTRAYTFLLKSRRKNQQEKLRFSYATRKPIVKAVKRCNQDGLVGDEEEEVREVGEEEEVREVGEEEEVREVGEEEEVGEETEEEEVSKMGEETEVDEENLLFTKLKLCNHGKKKNEIEDNFENISDNLNFLFSLMTSYFNYASGYRVTNRESVMMTSFCLLNEYITKRYEQKITRKKKKYMKRSQFYKTYKYIYLAEILYNLGRALHHLSYFNECMKLYLNVIQLIRKANKEIKKICTLNNLNINEKFILNHVINMKKCMCYTCLNFATHYQENTHLNNIINYYHNLNSKYFNLFLLFYDKRHLLFSASYNLSIIFRRQNRFEQAKYILRNIIWD